MKGQRTGSKQRWRFSAIGLAVFSVAALAGLGKVCLDYRALPPSLAPADLTISKTVLDRSGQLLRAFTTPDEKWRLPVTVHDVDPLYWKMLKAYEDRRFDEHRGVDVPAMARAAYQLLSSGHVVSGASTLTMQTARLLQERPTRSLSAKYHQILAALRLEADLSKEDILQLYALRAPFGGNLEGIRAAALTWFGKEPRRLTPAEAALLVALPQSPEARRPDRFKSAAQAARDRVLDRAVIAGVLSQGDADAAREENVPIRRRSMPFLAAHAARAVIASKDAEGIHRLTLDASLQQALETLIDQRIDAMGPKVSAALLVADHRSGEVLASVGSPNLMDEARLGHIDMTRAIRSPGSTLKPFIYGLAFEDGIAHPESTIDDRPIDIGGYKPTNFDLAYQGRVSVREALQLSLNTPAIQLLEAVGPAKLVARLKRSGAGLVIGGADAPGLAIGLGGLGMSLWDLTQLYGALGNGGHSISLHLEASGSDRPTSRRILEDVAAWHVGDVLTGLPQPRAAGANQIAYKTGTAYGYRDAWAIGYDGRHVVGVWVGRADGTPLPGMTGAGSAVPLLFEAFQRLKKSPAPLPAAPSGTLKMAAADLPLPLRAARVYKPAAGAVRSLEISYPPQSGTIDLGLGEGRQALPLVVKLQGGTRPFSWFVDGQPMSARSFASQLSFEPEGPGATSITVVDSAGLSDTVDLFIR
ncbi:penicillin-binding protein 1C [Roseibium polysiphoniae]|uniref:penicillin-binding protein 1C n=1 Tax=Roseibium polysiphoniae TaxID=2571221 RepID=UPI001BCD5A3D